MFAGFLIAFRETLEAALVVGIVWGYLARTGYTAYRGSVVRGVIVGIAASIAGAWGFEALAGGFEGRVEEIFEGVTMLVGGVLLSTMIVWMMNRNAGRSLEAGVAKAVNDAGGTTLFLLVFVAILREGIETVLFLGSARMMTGEMVMGGAALGILIAIGTGWAFFRGSQRLRQKTVFTISSVLLVLFAAGLFAHGVHELQEAGVLPVVVEHLWDVNPTVLVEGSYPVLHEKGAIGSILKGLFGYNGNPSLLEVLTYLGYVALVLVAWNRATGGRRLDPSPSTA